MANPEIQEIEDYQLADHVNPQEYYEEEQVLYYDSDDSEDEWNRNLYKTCRICTEKVDTEALE